MLTIVETACSFEPDLSKGTIVVESDCGGPPFSEAFQELEGSDPVRLAQGYASQRGVAPALLNGNKQGPYPVNREGLSLEAVRDGAGQPLPQSHPRMQPFRYRLDIPVTRPIR